jgi:hypothetical protein
MKIGEWSEGKRIKWFDQTEIEQLKADGKINDADLRFTAK